MSATTTPAPGDGREKIIAKVRAMVAEIDDINATAQHWNRLHPTETPIDPDPDGEMANTRRRLSTMLAKEEGRQLT